MLVLFLQCCGPCIVAALLRFLFFKWVFVSNVDSVFAPMTNQKALRSWEENLSFNVFPGHHPLPGRYFWDRVS